MGYKERERERLLRMDIESYREYTTEEWALIYRWEKAENVIAGIECYMSLRESEIPCVLYPWGADDTQL